MFNRYGIGAHGQRDRDFETALNAHFLLPNLVANGPPWTRLTSYVLPFYDASSVCKCVQWPEYDSLCKNYGYHFSEVILICLVIHSLSFSLLSFIWLKI